MNIKNKIKSIIPEKYHSGISKLLAEIFDGFSTKSYSQEGEDMILRTIFAKQPKGFYVDVGAHHPKRYSNTYFFYKRGWKGINIDAMPGSMQRFNKVRPRDINLEAAISDIKEKLIYYIFNDPALNTFSENISKQKDRKENYRIISTMQIETCTLEEILDRHLTKNQKIDFLSIDVEGFDFKVLRSNNWNKYRPNFILIEIIENEFKMIIKDKVYNYLKSKDYSFFAKTVATFIFKSDDWHDL